MNRSKITKQLIAGVAATISVLNVGFHMGWPAPSLPKLLAKDSDIIITSAESSWIVGCYTGGGVIGPCLGAVLVDRCGRKLSLLIGTIPQLCSCILIGVAQDFWWLIIARLIGGVAGGILLTALPMYLGEIADDRIRGALSTTLSVMLNMGILVTYSVGPWVSRQALAGLGTALNLLFMLMFIWMPESPYYLVMKEKIDRAEKTLLWFRGKEQVNQELRKVRENVECDLNNAGTIKELIMGPGNRKALVIVLGLVVAQQFSGIFAVISYSSQIFKTSGYALDPSITVIIIGLVQLLSGVLTLFTVDLAGRRPLLLLSAIGATLFLGGEALYFQLQADQVNVSGISWLPIIAILGFVICHTLGLGCIPYVVISEIFPCNVKALAAMVATQTMCAAGLVVAIVYQAVVDEYGVYVSFWGFTGLTLFSVLFIYFMLPETKQRSLQSIQDELHKTTNSKMDLVRTEEIAA